MASALISKIIADADTESTRLDTESRAKAAQIDDAANAEIERLTSQKMEEASLAVAEIKRRYATAAALEARKIRLKAKQDALTKAYAMAAKKIAELPRDKYLGVISGMLNYAEDGDVVLISAKDTDVITEKFIAAAAKKLGIKLLFSTSNDVTLGGIILEGKGCNKNLTLQTELRELREITEGEISTMLFGGKV